MWLSLLTILAVGWTSYAFLLPHGYSRPFRQIEAAIRDGSLVGLKRADLLARYGRPLEPRPLSYSTARGEVALRPGQELWEAGHTYDASWPVLLVVTFDEHDTVTAAELSQPDPKLYRIPKEPNG